MRPLSILLCSACLFISSIASAEDCPPNRVLWGCDFEGWGGISTGSAGMFDFNLAPDVAPWAGGDYCPTSCYDLKKGVVVSNAHNWPWGEDCSGSAEAHDVYQITGIAPQGPISFTAELQVTGNITGNGTVHAQLALDGDPGYFEGLAAANPVGFKVTMPLVREVGEPFPLFIWLFSAADAPLGSEVFAQAVIRFSGLPPGAYVISCQNYDLPVPTQASTWGRIKSQYR